MSISANHLDAVVAGLLSVNNYRVEVAWELLPRLRTEGLLDARRVAAMKPGEVARRLAAAGSNRGGITEIVAPRLQALMSAVNNGELDRLPRALQRGDSEEFARILLRLPGVGPRVAETVWLLLGDS